MTSATDRAGTPPAGGAPQGPVRSPAPRSHGDVPGGDVPRDAGPAPDGFGHAQDGFGHARAVADAVLWEGYLLYPYRRSSGKNRVRWQFGVLAPRPWLEAHGPVVPTVAGSADAWRQVTECLAEAPDDARLTVRVRFLQVQHRAVERRAGTDDGWTAVDALDSGDHRWLTFDEAVAHEVDVSFPLADLAGGHRVPVLAPGGEDVEPLPGHGARLVRRRRPVAGELRVSAAPAGDGSALRRVRLELANTGDPVPADAPREVAVRHSLVAAHCLLRLDRGGFVSLLDPPADAEPAVRACRNEHTFPVLAGPPGSRDVLLSSPIILYDHPRVAPESPGELFDSGEIDEILSLRTLTLTDGEKAEVRATDPRAAALLDRVDALPEDSWARLHGAIRSLRPVPPQPVPPSPAPPSPGAPAADVRAAEPGALPWWDPGADAAVSPETDAVVVDGVRVARGSRVRLRPRLRGADPQDRFLDGRTARVQAVFLDVDDVRHVAVTLDDDPEADLLGGTGRYRYFAPEEIRPLDGEVPP